MKIFKNIAATALVLTAFVLPAQANMDVWRDPVTKMTVSYPGEWRQVINQNPGDILTIQGAASPEFAQCVISTHEDGRFKIHTVGDMTAIQQEYFSDDYWNKYLKRYGQSRIDTILDGPRIDGQRGSMVYLDYDTAGGIKMRKRAIGQVAFFRNTVYTVECSAEASVFLRWEKPFKDVIASIKLHNPTNGMISSYYRDFTQDPPVQVFGPDDVHTVVKPRNAQTRRSWGTDQPYVAKCKTHSDCLNS